jgi:hypothetical protein
MIFRTSKISSSDPLCDEIQLLFLFFLVFFGESPKSSIEGFHCLTPYRYDWRLRKHSKCLPPGAQNQSIQLSLGKILLTVSIVKGHDDKVSRLPHSKSLSASLVCETWGSTEERSIMA